MFELPNLPYPYDALEPYIDKETMMIHHDKHHRTYVTNLNNVLAGHEDLIKMDINDLIKNLDRIPEDIRVKVRNNGGGHANHSMFWQMMAPTSAKKKPGENLIDAIKSSFGDFETFKTKFKEAALGHFGSGWAWLIKDGSTLKILDTPNQDSPAMSGEIPILGIDVWEHAYYLKYQNRRADYIDAWWNVVNWAEVERRLRE